MIKIEYNKNVSEVRPISPKDYVGKTFVGVGKSYRDKGEQLFLIVYNGEVISLTDPSSIWTDLTDLNVAFDNIKFVDVYIHVEE